MTIFHILLLLINAGMLGLLFTIAGQLNGQRQRTKTVPKQVTDLLEKILSSQRKAASALVTTNNEFRNHLKNMVINVESSTDSHPDTPGAAPLGDFKALRRDFDRIEQHFAGTLQNLEKLTEQTTQSVSELSMALQTDRQSERKLVTEFHNNLRADLGAQAERLQQTVAEISLSAPQAVALPPSGEAGATPVIDLTGPLNKWFNRTQELHDNLIKEIRGIGSNFTIPTEQLTKAADANVAQLRKILESFMIENARHDKQTEEFHRSLREDFQAHANLLGKVVSDRSSGAGAQPSPVPVQVSTAALDHSLKEWLGRTQEFHESMLRKIQATGGAKANGHGNGAGTEIALRDLRNTIDQHQESLHNLLQDFITENIRHNQSAEEFRSELREDFRNQTGLLSQAVSGITRKLSEPPASPPAGRGAPATDLEGPFNQWLSRTEELHRSLIAEIRQGAGPGRFPTDEFRQITDQHQDSLRKLLEDWTEESVRRVRATDELRAAIQQDIKTQADRLKQLAEARPATPTSGTITASAAGEESREWRDNVQTELRTIIDKLDRMHDRMEEIFQI